MALKNYDEMKEKKHIDEISIEKQQFIVPPSIDVVFKAKLRRATKGRKARQEHKNRRCYSFHRQYHHQNNNNNNKNLNEHEKPNEHKKVCEKLCLAVRTECH